MSFPVIFKILSKLQTERDCKWVDEIEVEDISPFMIQQWLSMEPRYIKYANKLNQSLFLPPKQYLLYAWAIIPKRTQAIRLKYIKKVAVEEQLEDVVYTKIRKVLDISDNDWKASKKYFENDLNKNKVEYFKMFGVDKKTWKKAGLDFKEMKAGGERGGKQGLDLFGI